MERANAWNKYDSKKKAEVFDFAEQYRQFISKCKTEKGPKRQAVCLNAGAALYIAGKAASIEEGVKLAESLIDSGAALKKLEEFVEETNK